MSDCAERWTKILTCQIFSIVEYVTWHGLRRIRTAQNQLRNTKSFCDTSVKLSYIHVVWWSHNVRLEACVVCIIIIQQWQRQDTKYFHKWTCFYTCPRALLQWRYLLTGQKGMLLSSAQGLLLSISSLCSIFSWSTLRLAFSALVHWDLCCLKWRHRESKPIGLFGNLQIETHPVQMQYETTTRIWLQSLLQKMDLMCSWPFRLQWSHPVSICIC